MSEGNIGLAAKPQPGGQNILRLIVLEDSPVEAQALIEALRAVEYVITATRVKSALEFQAALKKQEWDLILSLTGLVAFNATQALGLLHHAKLDIPLIIVGPDLTDTDITEALRHGACAALAPTQIEQLQLLVQRETRDLGYRRAARHYERLFRDSERRCLSLLETCRNAICRLRNGKVIYVNPAFAALTPGGEGILASITTLIHPDDRASLLDLLKRVAGNQDNERLTLRIRAANGTEFQAEVSAEIAYLDEQRCIQLTIPMDVEPPSAATLHHIGASSDNNPPPPAPPPALVSEKKTESALDPVMQQRLQHALSAGRFHLVYQPIVKLHGDASENYEVLVRMLDEQNGEIMPARFLPTAEKAGLMPAIDRWVIVHALRILAEQRSQGKQTGFMIKLSEDTMDENGLVEWIAEQLRALHLPGNTVTFLVKESVATRRLPFTQQIFNRLKQLRCLTGLDHFGADAHSLQLLEQLSVTYVKLSGHFLDNLNGDAKMEAALKVVVQTAHNLGALTIAGFVQEASKLTSLWQCNVDYIQGFFLQAPEQTLSFNFSEEN